MRDVDIAKIPVTMYFPICFERSTWREKKKIERRYREEGKKKKQRHDRNIEWNLLIQYIQNIIYEMD